MKKEFRYYEVFIAGVQVTSDNCKNITGENIKGKVSYDPETNILTLNNATIDGRIYFYESIENITITLVGENTITNYIGSVRGTKIINGTGSLKAGFIVCPFEQNTIIEDCTIDIDADGFFISGMYSLDNSTLTIKNANISSKGVFAIDNFKDIELIGCEIVKPTNAQIIDNEFVGFTGKYICDGDGNIAEKVVIKK